LAEFKSVAPEFGADIQRAFDLKPAMAKRRLTGSTGTKEVQKQLMRWKKQLAIRAGKSAR
jgi:argininosuccinate lyase